MLNLFLAEKIAGQQRQVPYQVTYTDQFTCLERKTAVIVKSLLLTETLLTSL